MPRHILAAVCTMAGSQGAKILGIVGWLALIAGLACIGYNAYFFHTPGPQYRFPTGLLATFYQPD